NGDRPRGHVVGFGKFGGPVSTAVGAHVYPNFTGTDKILKIAVEQQTHVGVTRKIQGGSSQSDIPSSIAPVIGVGHGKVARTTRWVSKAQTSAIVPQVGGSV